ncbi:MAG: AAA family ATPase [Chloroflexota bacterium]
MGRSDGQAIVGRSAELETARGVLRRALEGSPGVLVVGGEAGVGKTRLLEAVATDARAIGFRVATGASLRMDAGAMPYAAIVGALRQLVRDGDPGTIAASVGAYRHDVARLLPEIVRLAGTTSAPASGSGGSSVWSGSSGSTGSSTAAGPGSGAPDPLARLRLFEAVAGWLDRLAAATPLLLVLEDLHWADPATLDLVRSLALSLSGRTVTVVTLRTDEPAPAAVGATVAELVRDGATRLELAPLDRSTFGRLVGEAHAAHVVHAVHAGDPAPAAPGDEAVDRLFERSGGNPFLALELVLAGLLEGGDTPYAGVPPSLRDILDARLASLEDATVEVLRAAALHPGPIDDEVLAAVLGRDVGAVGRALREAHEAGVLANRPGAPAFRHALQRDVLLEQLGPGERRMLHGRFADALATGGRDPSRASAIAWHRDAAGDDARSLAAHVEAHEAAMQAFAFEAAADHAARAAELRGRVDPPLAAGLPDGPTLLEAASLAALLAGDPARSAAHARSALALAGDDATRAVSLHDRLRWALWEAGDHEGAAREVELAVARLGDEPAPGLRAMLTAQQAAMRMAEAEPGPALELADRAIRAARELGARDVEAIALGVRGRTLATHGQVDEGLASLRSAVAIADELHNLQGRLVGEAAIVAVLARGGRARDALAEIDAALAMAEASGLGRSLGAQLCAEAARASFAIGAWDEAGRRIADGLARRPAAVIEAHLRITALRLAAARGNEAEAAALEARLAALEPVLPDGEDRAALDVARAEAALAAGRPAVVRTLVDRAMASVAAGAERGASLAWLGALAVEAEVDLALAARARGDGGAAQEAAGRAALIAGLAQGEAARARAAWGPRADALLAHVQAEAARLEAPAAARAAAWERAAAAWDAIDRPYTAAHAWLQVAESRLAAGAPRPAIAEPLRVAAATLRGLGARPLLAQAERLARLARVDLAAAGSLAAGAASVGRDPLATLDLTPREREVLRLVAAGWGNARIAEHLAISTKTASVHVSNILGKLGVDNRVEAAALAHRLGVVGEAPGAGDAPDGGPRVR